MILIQKVFTFAKVGRNDKDKEFVKTGTVISYATPVISTTDKSKWRYKIKTSGEYFHGNDSEILKMLSEIEEIIKGE